MEEKKVTLNIDVEQSIQGLKDLKRQLKTTATGTEEFKQLYGAIDDLEDKIKSTKQVSADWIDTLEASGGVLGIVGKQLNTLKVSTQSFGGALKATGIGVVVGLLGLLAGAFSENDNMMKKLQPILYAMGRLFNGIFTAVEPLINIFIDLAMRAMPMVVNAIGEVFAYVSALAESFGAVGKAIYKLIHGDFKGAWESAKSSVTDFSKHHDEAVGKFVKGTKIMGEAEKEAAEKAKELRDKAEADRLAAEAKRLAALKAAEAERLRLAKEAAERREALGAEQVEEMERAKGLIDLSYDNAEQRKLDHEMAMGEIGAAQRKIDYEKEKADLEAVEQAKIDIRQKGYDNILAGIDVLKSVTGKSKELQKGLLVAEAAVGIAKIITNTQAANAAVTAKYALLPGGEALAARAIIMNNVSAGIGIAATLAATAKGLSALGGGGAPSGSGAPSGQGGGQAGAPQFNVIGANGVNQLAQSLGNKDNQPIKAYVVSGEMTTAQSLQRNIVNTATMKG